MAPYTYLIMTMTNFSSFANPLPFPPF